MAAVAALTLCSIMSVSAADSYKGEKTLGVIVGYNSYNERPLAGAQFSYRFNRLLRLSPEVTYVFRHDGLDALRFDLDMQFVFPVAQGKCDVFPYAGVDYSSWNYHAPDIDHSDATAGGNDVSTRLSRIGLNLGAGCGINLSGSLRLSVTAGYTFIQYFHGVDICAGIHYRF